MRFATLSDLLPTTCTEVLHVVYHIHMKRMLPDVSTEHYLTT